jgi:FKBP-type peptidyl-prolyl cis-trans isomerase
MAKDPGSTLQTASLLQVGVSPTTMHQALSLGDRADIWKFSLSGRSSASFSLSGIAKGANLDLSLLDSARKAIGTSRNPSNRAEQLTNRPLEAGTFYLRVDLRRGSAGSKYTLSAAATPVLTTTAPIAPTPVPAAPTAPIATPVSTAPVTPALDRFGGSFEAATALSLSSTVTTVSDFVGNSDPNDFLKFTLSAPGQVNLSLTGVSADAVLELYDGDRTLIGVANNPGAVGESLMQHLTQFGSTFYVRVAQVPGNETNYTLSYAMTPDVPTTTGTGLKYVDLDLGKGAVPTAGKTILVQYTGMLEDGTVFDSSFKRNQPFAFKLGAGSVIAGWDEGLSTMKVGGRRQLIIPPQLGYGATGVSGTIPPNATLIFEVELLGIY